ncbi:hypothetical protein [Streptomyces sp. NPDC004270]
MTGARSSTGSGRAAFGHDPDPFAEHLADTVRLTVDAEQSDSPVIELSVTELRHLLDGAEHDLINFLAVAADWVSHYLTDHFTPVTAALARVLALPASAVPPKPEVDCPAPPINCWPDDPAQSCVRRSEHVDPLENKECSQRPLSLSAFGPARYLSCRFDPSQQVPDDHINFAL